MVSGLSLAVFVALAFGGALAVIGTLRRLRAVQRNREDRAESTKWDIGVYISAMVMIAGVIGLGLELSPLYYQSLGAEQFLNAHPATIADASKGAGEQPTVAGMDTKFDGQSFFALLGILTGVPVALAGSVYAIYLARRAEQTAYDELVSDHEQRLRELTEIVTGHFNRLTEALLDINASAMQLFEAAFQLSGQIINGDQSLKRAEKDIERKRLPDLKAKMNLLRDCIADIQRHPVSKAILERSLDESRGQLAATYFLPKEGGKFRGADQLTWLDYGQKQSATNDIQSEHYDESSQPNIINAIELLRMQVERLCGKDVLIGVFETILSQALGDAERKQDVSGGLLNPDQVVNNGGWLTRPTRQKEEDYRLRTLGRVLLTRDLNFVGRSGIWHKISVNFGAVLLEDIYRLLPTRDIVQSEIEGVGFVERLIALDNTAIKRHFDSWSYESKNLFPQYFKQAIAESLAESPTPLGDFPILVLRLPNYISELNEMIRQRNTGSGLFREKWTSIYSGYVLDGLEEMARVDWAKGQSKQSLQSLCANEALIDSLDTAKKGPICRAIALTACAASDTDTADRYLERALALPGIDQDLILKCTLDLGDLAMSKGETAQATGYYERAFPGGRPENAERLAQWMTGLVRKLPFGIRIQGAVLQPDEVAGEDGLLPIALAFTSCRHDLAYRVDKKALAEVRTEFPENYAFPPVIELYPAMRNFFDSLPENATETGVRDMDEAYKIWFDALKNSEFKVLPAPVNASA